MFIIVKYGDNKSLICNPTCSVVNLLRSIKARAGLGASNFSIDLSDETGLVKDLDLHRNEAAEKYLDFKGTYILLEKQPVAETGGDDDGVSTVGGGGGGGGGATTTAAVAPTASQVQYIFVPLLERCSELFPNFVLHLSEEQQQQQQRKKKKPAKAVNKSPSPAGKMVVKSTKKTPQPAPPSRSHSRTKR